MKDALKSNIFSATIILVPAKSKPRREVSPTDEKHSFILTFLLYNAIIFR